MHDRFRRHADSPMAPAACAFAIAPSDSAQLPSVTKAIYVGGGGDIVLRPLDGTEDVLFAAFPGGGILDVRASAIRATGTSATNIVGLA
ncbi:spike base protein, RCAP_Rcc01079 family [Alteriqipengyuania lutimaris]|uniref:Uncharacterized protein n=1 Tax=Alteriqipengyuania lutimaris TaxID=1538146 RepID=A0A395LJ86_9SPHN|nr:hypothetical protein [Alteriqipengyuania lutimaris]MBB3034369.1 hypothetical protein [Alteriqipengyuania lutimaris]RDS76729.1 hypothetical protein DL238_03315 [Alteriqipengyuania lutimaris]